MKKETERKTERKTERNKESKKEDGWQQEKGEEEWIA